MTATQEVAEYLDRLPGTPDPDAVIEMLEGAFQALAESEYQQGIGMTVPGAGRIYGVRVPYLRALGKGIVERYGKAPAAIRPIALAVWERGSREHQSVALEMLGTLKLPPDERWELGVRLLPDVNNWEACDILCGHLLGEALACDPAYMDTLEGWLDDDNFWVRRAALVSTVLLRRAKYPPDLARSLDERALAMCADLLDDQEPYIRKAVDWAAREALKRHYYTARSWLMAQAEADPSRTARTTLKLIAKKLDDQDRDVFLAALEAT
jgi:3-methyladenine DNA glycosylase AlkD